MARETRREDRELRRNILDATTRLLGRCKFADLTVADILAEAGISRGSFYFYFQGKHEVLAELVRQAIDQGHKTSASWLGHRDESDRRAAIRRSIADGAQLWSEQAAVLRAIVEHWRDDPALEELWRGQMDSFAKTTAERIDADRAAGAISHHAIDSQTLAATLTWLGERLYYLAATGTPPFDNQSELVDVLTHMWMTTLYAESPR
ncbi:TetR/AcrR family transcriptional regulator [Fodinicola feengrottensis]